ncbi:extracellular catalytic domain type 1 short-chain-length polyhydroxyalkanoate depolymerase [Paracraurococcus ruber]|uniref:extracellular catalytic domain type 1 short-chain-length polyhydroxyalkanoate depolymerase n=1 Tax=Paracraurococcus ruber TaxID=77675 RepID=UPI001F00AFFA|nr:PHB depolymerase family esterase [Paracraurococcus ruber]
MPKPHLDLADLVRRSQAMAQGALQGTMRGAMAGPLPTGDGALREEAAFGSNPGQLRMLECVPDGLPPGAPLVVVLHGCNQTAAGFDRGTGWSRLAARHGFALLLPEQRMANNANRCFNWFEPGDTRRDRGEALSIRQMVAHAVARHRLDQRRVFVTGLSAGGAMASAMLATYPEVFAAGAIIAGLPYDAAHSMPEAFEAMATGRPRPAPERGEAVRRASPHRGPWPRVSVWQGDADATVRPANAEEILKQWRDLHGLPLAPGTMEAPGPAHRRRAWRGADGAVVLEHHAIAGMPHGVPIAPRRGPEAIGEPAPWILDVGIASTEAIAGFFGLGAAAVPDRPAPREAGRSAWLDRIIRVGRDGVAQLGEGAAREAPPAEAPGAGPGRLIRRALRAAGLLDR